MSGPILLTRAHRWRNGLPVFLTTAERALNIPAPLQGEACYVDDGTSAEGLYTFSGTAWVPVAWNTPWGVIARVKLVTTSQTGITTTVDITGATVTFTAVANRLYEVEANLVVQQVTSAATANVILTDGSNVVQTQPGGTFGANEFGTVAVYDIGTMSAGSNTRKLRAATGAGTLSVLESASSPLYLTVKDAGPGGAPT